MILTFGQPLLCLEKKRKKMLNRFYGQEYHHLGTVYFYF